MNKSKINKIIIIVFFGLLFLPNVLTFLGVDKIFVLNENRKLHKFSEINWFNPKEAAIDFKWAYKDNFGFKNMSFSFYSWFKSNLFDESALQTKTIKGREGWYFLGNDEGNVLNNSVGISKLSNKEKVIVQSNISSLFEKMDKLGFPFYMVISRHKHEVYPEYLPFTLKNSNSKFDELYANWEDSYYPKVLDLKRVVLENKHKGQLYHKTDTHWNELGALYGFNAIINRLQLKFPELEKAKKESYLIKTEAVLQQDLTAMINIEKREEIVVLEKKTSELGKRVEDYNNNYSTARFINPEKQLKVLIFRDSFSLAMMKYFKEAFGECLFVKTRKPDVDLIKVEKPDVIILQITSRRFQRLAQEKVYY